MLAAAKSFCSKDSPSYLRLTLKPTANTLSQAIIEVLFVGEPNAKWFTLVKVPLGIYCMSKADSIKGNKGFSKVLKKIGEAPVIYDEELTKQSLQNLDTRYAQRRFPTRIYRHYHHPQKTQNTGHLQNASFMFGFIFSI